MLLGKKNKDSHLNLLMQGENERYFMRITKDAAVGIAICLLLLIASTSFSQELTSDAETPVDSQATSGDNSPNTVESETTTQITLTSPVG